MFNKLFSRIQPKDRLDKIRRLKQTDEVWQCGWHLERTWITPKKDIPYRPYFFYVVSELDKIMGTNITREPPTADEAWEALLKAMRRPGVGIGGKRRPRLIVMNDEDLLQVLKPRLAEIEVACEYQEELPFVDAVSEAMLDHFNRDLTEPPSWTSVHGISTPLLGNIFELAAEFYRLAPWEMIPYEVPIKVRFPANKSPRYLVVMGTAGTNFGLSVHDRFGELRQFLAGKDPREIGGSMTWVTLSYDTGVFLSFDDLEAIERYKWPVVNEYAYPGILRIIASPLMVIAPSNRDLLWLEGALPILIDYFKHHFQLDEQGKVIPFEQTMTVETLNGPEEAYLGIPLDQRGRVR